MTWKEMTIRWTIILSVALAPAGYAAAQKSKPKNTPKQPVSKPATEPPIRGSDTKEGASQAKVSQGLEGNHGHT